jgi:diacylglycerol kinase
LARPFREALRAAGAGLAYAVRTQRNLRVQLAIAALVFLVGVLLGLGPVEVAVVVGLGGLVVAAELVNTSIEALVDLVAPDHRARAGVVKDVAAAAVLVCALAAAAGGAAVLGPPLLLRLGLPSRWPTPAVLAGAALVCAVLLVRLRGR